MELLNHFTCYRRVKLSILHDTKNKQTITPTLLFKTTDILQKMGQTEFSVLEKIPDMFSWKRFNNLWQRIRDMVWTRLFLNANPYNKWFLQLFFYTNS